VIYTHRDLFKMSEDRKQSDLKEEHFAYRQQIANWMREMVKGQEAQMKILNHLLERDGSLVDEVTRSTGDEETPSTELHLAVQLERIPDQQQLPEQTSNRRENPSVEVRKSSEQKLKGEPTFYNSPHLPHVDSKIVTKNRKERRALLDEKPRSDVPNRLASIQSDGKDNQFIGFNYTDNSKARGAVVNEVPSTHVRKQLASIQWDGQDKELIGLNSGGRHSRSSQEYKNYYKHSYML